DNPPASEFRTRPQLIYWALAGIILLGWTLAMLRLNWWGMFASTWPLSLTMVLGSFIAGATAEGGGAVAFPVFTKAFGIAATDAKIFSFMIQSFGMGMAALMIYLRGIPVLWGVVFFGLAGGVPGLVLGELLLYLPAPYPKLFFSVVAGVFGIFLIYNRWVLRRTPGQRLPLRSGIRRALFVFTGLVGGLISSVVGVGIDMATFIVLTLLFSMDEKISTPTTVIMMGLLSVVGFFWHGVVQPGISPDVWQYWMSCVPIVIFGAPLGAWACSKIRRDQLLYLLLSLILLDLASTLWLIPFTWERSLFMLGAAAAAAVAFWMMLGLRRITLLDE
ncbi:MAG: sulfite exporter TauE/SafE family protein, partial [Cyclonatronaceae bacterium]